MMFSIQSKQRTSTGGYPKVVAPSWRDQMLSNFELNTTSSIMCERSQFAIKCFLFPRLKEHRQKQATMPCFKPVFEIVHFYFSLMSKFPSAAKSTTVFHGLKYQNYFSQDSSCTSFCTLYDAISLVYIREKTMKKCTEFVLFFVCFYFLNH